MCTTIEFIYNNKKKFIGVKLFLLYFFRCVALSTTFFRFSFFFPTIENLVFESLPNISKYYALLLVHFQKMILYFYAISVENTCARNIIKSIFSLLGFFCVPEKLGNHFQIDVLIALEEFDSVGISGNLY